jgi:hypothetical protein
LRNRFFMKNTAKNIARATITVRCQPLVIVQARGQWVM